MVQSGADLFNKHFYGVFETEAEAEAYAQTASPRLWALVIFHKGPNALGSGELLPLKLNAFVSAETCVCRHSLAVKYTLSTSEYAKSLTRKPA